MTNFAELMRIEEQRRRNAAAELRAAADTHTPEQMQAMRATLAQTRQHNADNGLTRAEARMTDAGGRASYDRRTNALRPENTAGSTDIATLPVWHKATPELRDSAGNPLPAGSIRVVHDDTQTLKAVGAGYKIHQPRDVARAVQNVMRKIGVGDAHARMTANGTGLIIRSPRMDTPVPESLRKIGDTLAAELTVVTSVWGKTRAFDRQIVLACLNGLTTARAARLLAQCHRQPLDERSWEAALLETLAQREAWAERVRPYVEGAVTVTKAEARTLFAVLLGKIDGAKVDGAADIRDELTLQTAISDAGRALRDMKKPEKMVDRLMSHYVNGRGQSARGQSVWAWLNGVTDYTTHTTSIRDPRKREDSALAGALAATTERAYAIADVLAAGHVKFNA